MKYADASSKNGILQRVDHEADIWYVGVYQPSLPLGGFTLTLDDIKSSPASVEKFVIRDESGGRVMEIFPRRRSERSESLGLVSESHGRIGHGRSENLRAAGSSPTFQHIGDSHGLHLGIRSIVVPGSGFHRVDDQHRERERGWPAIPGSRRRQQAAGRRNLLCRHSRRSGGALGGEAKTASYTLQSRGIGTMDSAFPHPADLNGGSLGTDPLAPRDFRFFSVTIPPGANLTSWQLDLTPTAGEMLMQVRRDSIPDFFTSTTLGESPPLRPAASVSNAPARIHCCYFLTMGRPPSSPEPIMSPP